MQPGLRMDDEAIRALFERLALAAGVEIMAVRAAGYDVEKKADSSPVTEADTRAEAVILGGLERELAGVPHVGEEEISAGRIPEDLGGAFVLVDPLDGTREFVSGRDEFTVNIALVRDCVPEIGVVYAPARGVAWSGRPGRAERFTVSTEGAIEGRRPITVCGPENGRPRIVASRSHRTPETDDFIARHPGAEIVSVGSSLKFCLLAEGLADLYPRFGRTMEWDTAAGDAVLRAAGGKTCLVDGAPLTYGKRDQKDDSDFANPWFISRVD